MRGLLLWGLVIVVSESLLRLLCWSLLILIPVGIVESWDVPHLRWVTTGLAFVLAVLLWGLRNRFGRGDMARLSWLMIACLICFSVVAFGTETASGYTLFRQPTRRLAFGLATAGILLAAGAFWHRIDRKQRRARRAVVVLGAFGAPVFLVGAFANTPFESVFRIGQPGSGSLLRFVPPAVWCMLPLSLLTGIRISLADWRNGETPLLRQRWFEFAVIALAVLMGVAAMRRG